MPVTEATEKKTIPLLPEPAKGWFWGVGRRKTAVARVRIKPGKGEFKVNNRDSKEYFGHVRDRNSVVAPLKVTELMGKVDVHVNVAGGGSTGQAGAVMLGIARALKKASEDYLPLLREAGLLTRDSRMVERKKYGRSGARKRFQFSKR